MLWGANGVVLLTGSPEWSDHALWVSVGVFTGFLHFTHIWHLEKKMHESGDLNCRTKGCTASHEGRISLWIGWRFSLGFSTGFHRAAPVHPQVFYLEKKNTHESGDLNHRTEGRPVVREGGYLFELTMIFSGILYGFSPGRSGSPISILLKKTKTKHESGDLNRRTEGCLAVREGRISLWIDWPFFSGILYGFSLGCSSSPTSIHLLGKKPIIIIITICIIKPTW